MAKGLTHSGNEVWRRSKATHNEHVITHVSACVTPVQAALDSFDDVINQGVKEAAHDIQWNDNLVLASMLLLSQAFYDLHKQRIWSTL